MTQQDKDFIKFRIKQCSCTHKWEVVNIYEEIGSLLMYPPAFRRPVSLTIKYECTECNKQKIENKRTVMGYEYYTIERYNNISAEEAMTAELELLAG